MVFQGQLFALKAPVRIRPPSRGANPQSGSCERSDSAPNDWRMESRCLDSSFSFNGSRTGGTFAEAQ